MDGVKRYIVVKYFEFMFYVLVYIKNIKYIYYIKHIYIYIYTHIYLYLIKVIMSHKHPLKYLR
jgi:hypothetical protein